MVQIIWSQETLQQLRGHLEYAYSEFGMKTMNKFISQVEAFEKRIRLFPESYKPVPELSDLPQLYRGCTVMKHFLLIHYYDAIHNVVYVDYIWDMRRNPNRLKKQFGSKDRLI